MELSQTEQENLLRKLEIFKIQGSDKLGRPILLITGKLFPARLVGVEALKKFLEAEIFPLLEGKPYSVVYLHTGFNRRHNFPGIAAFKSLYEAVPDNVRNNLGAVYFLHPGLLSRLFLLFSGGLHGKLEYVTRLEFLWSKVKKKTFEVPDFVYQYEEEMEQRPMIVIDYGLESDHPKMFREAADCGVYTYSTRHIA